MTTIVFRDRTEAGEKLGEAMKGMALRDPLVLAIPRGGVEVGAPLARALGAEMDVVLARKLRAPEQPELAIGAIGETGEVHIDKHAEVDPEYLAQERRHQMEEIDRRKRMIRGVRPQAPVAGRSVILTDDGIATGSTMIAAIRTVRAEGAGEVIVAVPVASGDRLGPIRELCDRVVCLSEPEDFWAVGQFYIDFGQTSDDRVVELLREFGQAAPARR